MAANNEACILFPLREASAADAARMAALRNLLFPGAEARALIRALHDVAVSTRSACSSGSEEACHALLTMGLTPEEAHGRIRFSLGRATTREEIDRTVDKVAAAYPAFAARMQP